MHVDQEMRGMFELEDLAALCERWAIPYEVHPTSRMLRIGKTDGPVDISTLPSPMDARTDVQRLLHTYMRTAHQIIFQFWGEEE